MPYRWVDSQNLTIGYGPWSNRERAPHSSTDLLRNDLTSYIISVRNEFSGISLKQNQFDAPASLCYNPGPNIWLGIHLTIDIKGNASADVILKDFQALDHVKSVGIQGLLNRRNAEYKMYEESIYLIN